MIFVFEIVKTVYLFSRILFDYNIIITAISYRVAKLNVFINNIRNMGIFVKFRKTDLPNIFVFKNRNFKKNRVKNWYDN